LKNISQALGRFDGDVGLVVESLCLTLKETMQLEYASLLMDDGQIISTGSTKSAGLSLGPEKAARIMANLHQTSNHEIGLLRDLDIFENLSQEERSLILGPNPHIWLLLHGHMDRLGLVVLGPKRGRGEFEPGDLEILQVVVRQASSALENARLLEEVRRHASKIESLHRQVLFSRENERKRLARDVHDQIIQSLVGLNYRLARLREHLDSQGSLNLAQLQCDLRLILVEARDICYDLRPPALDTLGLVPALESRISEIQSRVPFRILFLVQGDEEKDIPKDTALCLFRVFQEALQNVQKHAGANLVSVRLEIGCDSVTLTIQDDGRGFKPPTPLDLLAKDRHFGLLGVQELLQMVQGELKVSSNLGKGCKLAAQVSLIDGNQLNNAEERW
jgi:signal transduction histidine kinase